MPNRSERAQERHLRTVAKGAEAAQGAIRATADHEDQRAVDILSAQDYETLVWTATYILGCLREMARILAAGDTEGARQLLHAGAGGVPADGLVIQAESIIAAALNHLNGA